MTKKNEGNVAVEQVKNEPEIVLIEFTIKKNGLGLEYVTMEEQKKGSMVMLAETKRKSPFPPTSKVLRDVDRLKLFFAKACALWHDSFDKFITSEYALMESVPKGSSDEMYEEYKKANDTLEAIRIEKVSFNGGFKLDALVETMEGKYTRMKTPKIDEEDEIFADMDVVMDAVRVSVIDFIRDVKYDVKAESHDIVMRALRDNEEALEKLRDMSERDIFLNAIEQLEMKGALVMMSPELEVEIQEAKKERELEQKSKNVDIPQEIINEESVQQFAGNQTNHLSDARTDKKIEDDDNWEGSLKLDKKEEEGVTVGANEDFL